LGRNGVNVVAIAQGSSEYNISVIIHHADLTKGLNTVHDAFFAELQKTLHVFVVGVGNIGKELLKQINDHHGYLVKNNLLNIKIVGLTNSRKMLIDAEGLDLNRWESALEEKGETADLAK